MSTRNTEPTKIPWTEQNLRKRAAELEADNSYWLAIDSKRWDAEAEHARIARSVWTIDNPSNL